jgi:hypothetical protein
MAMSSMRMKDNMDYGIEGAAGRSQSSKERPRETG